MCIKSLVWFYYCEDVLFVFEGGREVKIANPLSGWSRWGKMVMIIICCCEGD